MSVINFLEQITFVRWIRLMLAAFIALHLFFFARRAPTNWTLGRLLGQCKIEIKSLGTFIIQQQKQIACTVILIYVFCSFLLPAAMDESTPRIGSSSLFWLYLARQRFSSFKRREYKSRKVCDDWKRLRFYFETLYASPLSLTPDVSQLSAPPSYMRHSNFQAKELKGSVSERTAAQDANRESRTKERANEWYKFQGAMTGQYPSEI